MSFTPNDKNETMYPIPFTQYLRPHGRTRQVFFLTENKKVFKQAMELISYGYTFEVEILTTSQVSATLTGYDPLLDEEQDILHAVTTNDESVVTELEALVKKASAWKEKNWEKIKSRALGFKQMIEMQREEQANGPN